MSKSHQIITSKKHAEPFSRDVLFVSILDTLKHRKTALKDATYLTDTIIKRILALKTAKIPTTAIKQAANTTLKNFDPLAAKIYTAIHG